LKKQILRFIDWFGSWRYYLTGRLYYYGFSAHRDDYMRLVARLERIRLQRPLRILEIGTFRGHSALLWEEFGDVTCIDAWTDPLTYAIFKRNVRLAGKGRIEHIRADSREGMLSLIGKFDLIYIDAGHDYENCYGDLCRSIPLLTDGGILCGDDLQFQSHELCWPTAAWVSRIDFDWCPGVTRAVAEVLGPVWCKNAFFAVRYREGRFVPYTLFGAIQ